ncbi:MAG: hypothetical protein HOV80_05180 [Polyangiaceae bacterium]|nr:hypothetical protein [Polyangiaceae bacterium]
MITQGAREMAVDDFIDSHLQERAVTDAEPPTHRRMEPGVAPMAPPPAQGWGPAAPPRPGNTAKPYNPTVKTIPMQAVALPPRLAAPPAPPPPASHDDEGGGRTMMLTPEQAEAAQRALAAATAGAAPKQAAAPAPPPTGLSGTIMMEAVGPAPQMAPPAAPPAPPQQQMPSYIMPAQPQGPAPSPMAQPSYEPMAEHPQAPPKKGGAGLMIGVGIAFAVVAGVGVAYWQGLISLPLGGSPSSRSTPAATSESTSAPAPATSTSPTATSTAAAPSSSGPAEASASAGGAPPIPASPGDDKPLLSYEAALTVTSSIDAEVVVQGISIGRTNKRLVTRCGPKNVRLRVEGKGWVSPGQPVHITCMQSTSVTIEPSS